MYKCSREDVFRKRLIMNLALTLTTIVLLFCYISTALCQGNGRKNILFIVADDMRPQIGSYLGRDFPSKVHPTVHTPNIDALAARSLLLKRAYVQEALCSPSRTSLLTGRRPDTTHVYRNGPYFRQVGGNYTTIPEFFKNNGYRSIGIGKIFHAGRSSGDDDPVSWTDPYYHPPNDRPRSWQYLWRGVSKEENEIRPLPDVQTKDQAKLVLNQIAPDALSGKRNFFLAVGFLRPHIPFIIPEKYLNLYPRQNIRLPDNPYAPVYMPEIAWYNYVIRHLGQYEDVRPYNVSGTINTTMPDELTINLRRAYYAAVSYVDDLVGEVVAEMDKLGLTKNTIVTFWGDHGWHIGEHGEWCKQSNFENTVHAPMMIRVPGLTDNGIVTERLTEFVDLFPTLVEAVGFSPLPLCPNDSTKTALCTEGASLVPLMKNPTRAWKSGVFSQYPKTDYKAMGYTLRTDRYRYTEWPAFTMAPVYKPNWENLYGVELYDHSVDPDENYNRFNDTRYQDVAKQLRVQLRRGWRYSQPPNTAVHNTMTTPKLHIIG